MESYMLKYVGRWFETCHQQFILHYFRVLRSSNKPQHIKKMRPEIFPNKPSENKIVFLAVKLLHYWNDIQAIS